MKNTILSRKDADLLEESIIKYGRIVTFEQLKKVFRSKYSEAQIKNRLSLLAKIGWLIRFKKGLYAIITDIGSLTSNDISLYTICNTLNKDAYISFENALQFHGMFDQMLSSVSAITYKRARTYTVKDTEIKFYKIKNDFYFGFSQKRSDIGFVNIASKEKALLDMLYFRSSHHYADLVWEILSEYKHKLDFFILKEYARKFTLGIIRQIGFFLDQLTMDTSDLYKIVKGKTSYSRMTMTSKDFNAKWRLYFKGDG